MPSIVTSTRDLAEGETVRCLFSGFTPGRMIYYRVTGKGIQQRDFSSGRLMGGKKIDSLGNLVLEYTTKADNVKEGMETFSVQVFYDKSMKISVAASEFVSIADRLVSQGKNADVANDDLTGVAVDR